MAIGAISRVLLAVYLAFSSPALCCCALRAAADRALGLGSEPCHQESCCARAMPMSIPRQASIELEAARPVSCCEAASSEPAPADSAPPESSPCRCHERDTLVIRMDGPSVAVVAGQLLEQVLVRGFASAPMADVPPCVMSVQEARRSFHDPPAPTLLRQHCLLLI